MPAAVATAVEDVSRQPSAKRPRIDEEETHSSGEISRWDPWYEDGNIVLVAADGTGKAGFRVHRQVLSKHSSVFHDMFSVGHPESSEKQEGCPVVHVSDPAIDLKLFLRGLYDPLSLIHFGEQMDFSEIAPLLELAHKYNVESLRTELLGRLRTVFCHKFAEFRSSAWFCTAEESDGHLLHSAAVEVVPSRDAIRAVNLVRLLGESSMLPMALYLCSLLDSTDIICGTVLENRRRVELSKEDQVRCVRARTTLAFCANKGLEKIHHAPLSGECKYTKKCSSHIEKFSLGHLTQEDPFLQREQHLLWEWEPYIKQKVSSLCALCRKGITSSNLEWRRHCWEMLPKYLGLDVPEGWEAVIAPGK
ncbi:hypothetical protein C8Q78DRAFT_986635 [Trametes maxima]|nr:hypothetical protein C8Q78DRAFT_986635 [Trametes maxima]